MAFILYLYEVKKKNTWAFLNLFLWYLPAVWATKVACFPLTAMKSYETIKHFTNLILEICMQVHSAPQGEGR